MSGAVWDHRAPASLRVTGLTQWGFEGGTRVRDLQRACHGIGAPDFPVPRVPGVYTIVWHSRRPVRFLRWSRGGGFKGRDPTVSIEALRIRWVSGASIVYIGKAGGRGQCTTLHSQLLAYVRFGLGQPTAHWGGRYIWQLSDASALRVYWKPVRADQPRVMEKQLLAAFLEQNGQRPFANLTR